MSEHSVMPADKRNIWLRGLIMLLMGLALHVLGTVLFVVAVVQFVLVLLNGEPNARLAGFGRSLGRYAQQLMGFLSFATEEIPFPFNDWPGGD